MLRLPGILVDAKLPPFRFVNEDRYGRYSIFSHCKAKNIFSAVSIISETVQTVALAGMQSTEYMEELYALQRVFDNIKDHRRNFFNIDMPKNARTVFSNPLL